MIKRTNICDFSDYLETIELSKELSLLKCNNEVTGIYQIFISSHSFDVFLMVKNFFNENRYRRDELSFQSHMTSTTNTIAILNMYKDIM